MLSKSSDTNYWEISSTAIPAVSSVRLYTETMNHIGEKHPEVIDAVGLEGILGTVSNPTRILESRTNPEQALVFVSDNVKYLDNPLYVPVKLVEGTSARVRTAYFNCDSHASGTLGDWQCHLKFLKFSTTRMPRSLHLYATL